MILIYKPFFRLYFFNIINFVISVYLFNRDSKISLKYCLKTTKNANLIGVEKLDLGHGRLDGGAFVV